jgi:hypothetical protein
VKESGALHQTEEDSYFAFNPAFTGGVFVG